MQYFTLFLFFTFWDFLKQKSSKVYVTFPDAPSKIGSHIMATDLSWSLWRILPKTAHSMRLSEVLKLLLISPLRFTTMPSTQLRILDNKDMFRPHHPCGAGSYVDPELCLKAGEHSK